MKSPGIGGNANDFHGAETMRFWGRCGLVCGLTISHLPRIAMSPF